MMAMGHKGAINLLLKSLRENNKRKERGIPVSAVIYGGNLGWKTLVKNNIKTKDKKEDPTTHAEYLLVNELKEKLIKNNNIKIDKLKLMVNIPPCEKCLEEISKIGIKNVYYLDKFSYQSKLKKYNKKYLLKVNLIYLNDVNKYNKINDIVNYFNSYIISTYAIRWTRRILNKNNDKVNLSLKGLDYAKIINKSSKDIIFNIKNNETECNVNIKKLEKWIS